MGQDDNYPDALGIKSEMDASIQAAIGLATTCSNGSDILLVTAEDHGAGSALLLVVESTTTISSDY